MSRKKPPPGYGATATTIGTSPSGRVRTRAAPPAGCAEPGNRDRPSRMSSPAASGLGRRCGPHGRHRRAAPGSRSPVTRVVLVVPDAGPLISLAKAGSLDVLLDLSLPVYVVDQVRYEVTKDRPRLRDAQAIDDWIDAHQAHVHEFATAVGRAAAARRQAGETRQPGQGEQGSSTPSPGCAAKRTYAAVREGGPRRYAAVRAGRA